MTAKYQLYKDNAGKFRFRLIAENGKTVAVGEAYERHASCVNGIESVRKNYGAAIEDTTIEGPKIPFPKYQVFVDKAGEYRFNLCASNGEVIASSEGYSSKDGCLNGIASVQRIGNSEIEDLTIEQKAEEPVAAEKPEPAEEKAEAPMIVAQATPAPEPAKSKDEAPPVKPKASSSRNALALIALVIGIVLLAVGFASFGAILGPMDATSGTAVLLAGEVVIGISLILFLKKK